MVSYAKNLGFIKGIVIGRDQIDLSHLQFADDTHVFVLASGAYLKNYKCLLAYFSVLSRLNINFSKSALIAIGCDKDWVDQIRLMLCCFVFETPHFVSWHPVRS